MNSSSNPTVEACDPYIRFLALSLGHCIDWAALEQVQLAGHVRAIIATAPWDRFFSIIEPTYMELTLEFYFIFTLQHVMTIHDEPCHHHIHYLPSLCWTKLTASMTPYDPTQSKATSLPLTLRYIHVILAHTLTG